MIELNGAISRSPDLNINIANNIGIPIFPHECSDVSASTYKDIRFVLPLRGQCWICTNFPKA